MDDSTVAVEVAASQALIQWPYLSDVSLINAVASTFVQPQVLPGAEICTTLSTVISDGDCHKSEVLQIANRSPVCLRFDNKCNSHMIFPLS